MQAIALSAQGAQPTLTELPTPQPAAGEVLVRVQASSVNGFDLSVAGGHLAAMMEHRYPVVLGKDFAGVVEAIGEGVTSYQPGDPVFGVVTKAYLGDGGFGEYVTVSEQVGLAKLPEGADPKSAGALGLAGTAAVDTLAATAPQSGETVLISGATGGVGAIAIQYAVAAGATVIATARPGAETDFVRGLGAHEVVDHSGDVPAQVRAVSPDGVNVILHLAGDGATLAALLTEKGRLASLLGFGADQHPAATFVYANPAPATLDRLAADLAAGRLTVPVAKSYTLAEVPAAFDDFAGGTLGKIAITV
ncbi:NADP-dependent oxidoreductase [Actinoplanes couchii]|uniref:NADPH:quinone reductase n=1 Tax=Actinoplanes couchii TaxID=403638 RepID=A0ABQ3XS78_9ACTN|nr:NADP-dependent oxidoreductase [Actinoplanes couchii]MDR6318480.1 NADPH:quinone reductase-like Zn-dependent oxidoreductase [Actinoplanes couchii]GID61237.1 NADPH:quinone reductase [Actinoplanes couchii]